MTDNMGSMGDVAKYGGTARITGEDMRRRNEDNAKARAACADQAEDWAARDIAIPQGLLTHCPCPDPLAKIERDMRDENTEAVVAWARGLLGLVDESAVREAMGLPNG